MNPTPPVHLPPGALAALKLAILALAVVLEYTGHLTGSTAAVLAVVAGAFGLQGAIQALGANAAAAPSALATALGPLLSFLSNVLTPPAAATPIADPPKGATP